MSRQRRYSPERHIDLKMMGPIRAKNRRYLERKKQAIAYIEQALAKSTKPYLALSGGKDSVAMLGLVADIARKAGRYFVCWSHVSDASFPGTRETIIEACNRAKVNLIIDESPVSAWDVIGLQSKQKFGKKGYFFDRIRKFVEQGGYDLVFVGVRAMESKRRFRACISQGAIFKSGDILKCHPIQWFSIEDVAAAIYEYNMPIHPIYNKVPVGHLPIRLGYATALDLIDRGTVCFMRRNYPSLYKKLVIAYPEAANYR